MTSPIPKTGTPGISFIVNSYNQAATITDCLRGALSQQLGTTAKELIVVDDGSNDGTLALVAEELAGHRPDAARCERLNRVGGTRCRQHGVEVAQYELVLLLGGDVTLTDPTVVRTMLGELREDEPFVSLYGPHGGNATLYRRGAVHAVGGWDLAYNRFGSGYRDDSDLHYRLLDRGWRGRHLPQLHNSFRHEQARRPGVLGAIGYAAHRVAVHQLDPLLFRRHPTRFRGDFRPIGRLANPVDDFKRATGLWQRGGRFGLSSPQGITLVSGGTVMGRAITVLGGVVYVLAVHGARIRGSLRYRKILI